MCSGMFSIVSQCILFLAFATELPSILNHFYCLFFYNFFLFILALNLVLSAFTLSALVSAFIFFKIRVAAHWNDVFWIHDLTVKMKACLSVLLKSFTLRRILCHFLECKISFDCHYNWMHEVPLILTIFQRVQYILIQFIFHLGRFSPPIENFIISCYCVCLASDLLVLSFTVFFSLSEIRCLLGPIIIIICILKSNIFFITLVFDFLVGIEANMLKCCFNDKTLPPPQI